MITPPEQVRKVFRRAKNLKDVPERGWTLDVLNIVRRITDKSGEFSSPSSLPTPEQHTNRHSPRSLEPPGEGEAIGRRKYLSDAEAHSEAGGLRGVFTNSDIYAFERELSELHPDNRHIRDKIRQQLQVLRDTGFLTQPERGVWHTRVAGEIGPITMTRMARVPFTH